uniref:Uncharacterized protein n=1 Tax=Anguilla anguilla TaxID=7936 RepID=A0A0E9VE56_ANGAN
MRKMKKERSTSWKLKSSWFTAYEIAEMC